MENEVEPLYKLLVCGDRNWTDKEAIYCRLRELGKRIIIEGDARGADRLAGEVADELGYPHVKVPANWNFYKKAAGPIRNRWMLDLVPDHVLAFHRDLENSKGTKDCVTEARRRGITTEVFDGRE